jgi:hypothetical protein
MIYHGAMKPRGQSGGRGASTCTTSRKENKNGLRHALPIMFSMAGMTTAATFIVKGSAN